MESGDHAIAEWKLTARQTVHYGVVSFLVWDDVVRVEHGKIGQWSDYYDHS